MAERIKETLQIKVYLHTCTVRDYRLRLSLRIMTATPQTEPEAVPAELFLIDGSQNLIDVVAALSSQTALILGFCTSGQMLAADFFLIPPRDGHPCLSGWTVPTLRSARDLHPLADIHTGQTAIKKGLCQKSDFGPAYHKLGSYQVSI